MSEIEVVHLVWAATGMEPFRRFLSSYRGHPAGVDHELVILFNGFTAAGLDAHRELLEGVPHRELRLPFQARDIPAYFWAAEQSASRYMFFINSYSTLLADDWLRFLHRHVTEPGVGAVGATGSWESFYTNYLRRFRAHGRPSSPVDWARYLGRLVRLARYRADFNPTPNPHLRSNAFMIERATWLGLKRSALRTKRQTWVFESGRRGMTAQLSAAALEVRVVGRDGQAYGTDRWHESRTFRLGRQENLLVADNRTRQYDEADNTARRFMTEIAWGNA
jgi:hypothetical protein